MKKVILLLFTITIIFWGCGNNSDTDVTPKDESTGTMSCTINGKAWKANSTLSGIVKGLGTVSLYGEESGSKSSILMAFEEDLLKAGTNIVLKEELFAGINLQLTGYTLNGKDYNASSGSIVLTSASKTAVKGTFSFKAYDNDNKSDIVTITDGKFDLKLSE